MGVDTRENGEKRALLCMTDGIVRQSEDKKKGDTLGRDESGEKK